MSLRSPLRSSLRALPFSPALRRRVPVRRRHHLLAAGVFLVLGFHVGVWAVQLAHLAAFLRLDPGALGAAVTAAAAAGVATLVGGGRLADRFGRRFVLLTGFAGTAASFALLARVDSPGTLVPVMLGYGLTVSFVDLGANTLGADYEHAYDRRAMTGLHAGFSLGALLGAALSSVLLWSGTGFRTVYLLLAAVLAGAGAVVAVVSLPPRTVAGDVAAPAPGPRRRGVWRVPGVGLAMAVVAMSFFGDGALESFLAVYLSDALGSGVLLTGAGIGGYHGAALLGRLLATRVLERWGERRVVLAAGLLASAGIAVVVLTRSAEVAAAGLLLVGFATAPIAPTALSLAGRSVPGRSGQAVAATTAAGYSAFIAGPVLVGGLADALGLRTALALLAGTTLAVAVLSARWPDAAAPGR